MKRVFIISRETQKQVFERLTEEVDTLRSELQEYKTLIGAKEKEILELTMAKDDIFEGICDYAQMKKRIPFLEVKNKSLEDTPSHENRVHKLVNEHKAHNERGAGAKSEFTDLEKDQLECIGSKGRL